jgi:stringent starvation protein B
MTMTPSRSYLLSALHQWITDNDLTPYLAVDARVQGVMVPEQFTLDDQLVLNISYSAVQQLSIDQEGVSFSARFGGVPMNVFIPLAAVLAIYARENAQGMGFGMEPGAEELMQLAEQQPPEDSPPTPSGPAPVSSKKSAGSKSRTTLKVVK